MLYLFKEAALYLPDWNFFFPVFPIFKPCCEGVPTSLILKKQIPMCEVVLASFEFFPLIFMFNNKEQLMMFIRVNRVNAFNDLNGMIHMV